MAHLNLSNYSETFQIGSFDTDLNGNAKLTSICNYLQEIAGKHVDAIHQGIDDLKKDNLAWVLSRLKVKVHRLPKWKEKIRIETWSTGSNGLFGNREFKLFDAKNNIISIATSSWLVVNTCTKRPIRPTKIIEKMPFVKEFNFDTPLQKLPIIDNFETCDEIKIHYSDIDINQHVNNVKYVKWVIDACPPELFSTSFVEEIELHFSHEIKLNDKVNLFKKPEGSHTFKFVLKNQQSETEHCRAIVKWK